jgi:hypothetical protein
MNKFKDFVRSNVVCMKVLLFHHHKMKRCTYEQPGFFAKVTFTYPRLVKLLYALRDCSIIGTNVQHC